MFFCHSAGACEVDTYGHPLSLHDSLPISAPIVAEEAARPAPEEALRQRMAATQVVKLLARAGKQRQPADDDRDQEVHDPQPDAARQPRIRLVKAEDNRQQSRYRADSEEYQTDPAAQTNTSLNPSTSPP